MVSNVLLWASAFVFIDCWVESLRIQLCLAPVCKDNRVLLVMSGMGSYSWDGSVSALFLSLHFLKIGQILGQGFCTWVVSYVSTGSPVLIHRAVTSGPIYPIAMGLSYSHLHRLPGASHIPGLWQYLEMLHTLPTTNVFQSPSLHGSSYIWFMPHSLPHALFHSVLFLHPPTRTIFSPYMWDSSILSPALPVIWLLSIFGLWHCYPEVHG